MFNATYFDGRSATIHAVTLSFADGMLHLAGNAITQIYHTATLKLSEPFLNAPAMLYLPDGGHCEVRDSACRAALDEALSFKPTLVMRWQRHALAAVAAVALLLGIGIWIWLVGLPVAAEKIADHIPASLDARIGENALRGLEGKVFEPTRLSDQRLEEMRAVLADVSADLPDQARERLRLKARSAPLLGPNALALPDGTIVVTDQLVKAMYDSSSLTPEQSRQALAGVLAHEVGHIQGRHSVRALARSSLAAAASATLFGDFSAVAAGIPALLSNLHYSRSMETEADEYAIAVLKKKGWSTEFLARTLAWLERVEQNDPGRTMPAWMRAALPYASSHPGTADRIARLRAVAPPTHPD